MTHDDSVPPDETDVSADALASRGIVERDGVYVDLERDWFTTSGLRQRLREIQELLHEVVTDRNRLLNDNVAIAAAAQVVSNISDQMHGITADFIARYEQAASENDALRMELAAVKETLVNLAAGIIH